MVPAAPALAPPACPQYIGVHLDGRPIGFIESRSATRLAARLRAIKAARLASEQGRSPADLPPLQACHSTSSNIFSFGLLSDFPMSCPARENGYEVAR